jgi:hypothetical protein
MSGRGIPFVFDRLNEIRDQLHLYGFRLDPRPGTSYVDPTYAAEPRTGIVEVTAGLEDCPLDVRVQLVEQWRAGIDGAHAQRGLSVLAYTYWVGCVDPAIDLHYDLDHVRHPEMPLHWHPPAMTVVRRPCGPATPGRAMQAALQLAGDIERLQAQDLNAAADIVDSLDLGDYVP